MPPKYENSKLEDFDFGPIHENILKIREANKNRSSDEKKAERDKKQILADHYGYAIIDGILERVSNCMVEPPGIFRGRGDHPASGKIKGRILPENVTLNIGKDDFVPKCSLPGHCWKEIVSNSEATWLAFFKDEKRNKTKYIFLANNSRLKGLNDLRKYEKARMLKNNINNIRESYMKTMKNGDITEKQLAVATYVIDKLALRVGNEKGEDEADTVGCCSLRVEHVELEENSNKITLDFLGKDSMRYHNTVEVDPLVYKNLHDFKRAKNKENNLFDMINVTIKNNTFRLLN